MVSEPRKRAGLELSSPGAGVDHVLDVASGDSIARSMDALTGGGNIVIVGPLQRPTFTLEILPFLLKQATIHTLRAGSRETFERMNRALEMSKIRPVIDREYAFADLSGVQGGQFVDRSCKIAMGPPRVKVDPPGDRQAA
jgi:NADPH:quinone reductase-like Zn-dependent oxidoreductase